MDDSAGVIVFCKPPVPGQVKTRLSPMLGEDGAAGVYRALLVELAKRLADAHLVLYSAGGDNTDQLIAVFGSDRQINIQQGNDLGQRMAGALAVEAARQPNRSLLLVGSDIPGLDKSVLDQATKLLELHDVVLGPSEDGGYYLVGFSPTVLADARLIQQCFEGIAWSTAEVLEHQKRRMQSLGLKVAYTRPLRDLDTPGDFLALAARMPFLREHLPDVRVVMPVLNEKGNLRFVLEPLLRSGYFREVICADNGSTDGSVELARSLGARVTHCSERGYGATCLVALEDIRSRGGCDIVLFVDGDGADDPADLPLLLHPVMANRTDLVIGVRTRALADPGALLPQAVFGNWLATWLMSLVWGQRFFDLGPFRAVRWDALERLQMDDRNFGWTIQMQIRAIREGLRFEQVDVHYRKRHSGRSKVTANIRAIFRAGRIILWTVFREWAVARRMRAAVRPPRAGSG